MGPEVFRRHCEGGQTPAEVSLGQRVCEERILVVHERGIDDLSNQILGSESRDRRSKEGLHLDIYRILLMRNSVYVRRPLSPAPA